jgi:hypothetical protein
MKAFPTPTISVSDEARITSIGGEGGMDLRDYFAAKAMQILVHSMGNQGNIHIFNDVQAEVAYQMADAMLKAREV